MSKHDQLRIVRFINTGIDPLARLIRIGVILDSHQVMAREWQAQDIRVVWQRKERK